MVPTLAPTVWKYIYVLYEKIMMENHRTFIKQAFRYKFVHITCRNLNIFVRNRQACKFTLQYNIIIILSSDGSSGSSLVAVVVCISETDRQTAIYPHTCTAHYHHPWPPCKVVPPKEVVSHLKIQWITMIAPHRAPLTLMTFWKFRGWIILVYSCTANVLFICF